MRNGAAYSAYNQNNIQVESPQKLVEMMYEGILKFSAAAKRAIDANDIEKKVYYINKCADIFAELINGLDFDSGGNMAHYLNGLYLHQIKLLTEANAENNKDKIDIVMKVAKGLLEAWREITQNEVA